MKDIDNLLEKFYSGDTNLDEELFLKDFFSKNDLSEKYFNEKIMFDYFQKESSTQLLKEDFDIKIIDKIEQSKISKVDFRVKMQRLINIAAIIAIAIGFYIFFSSDNNEIDNVQLSKEDYNNFIATYNALSKASEYMNKANLSLAKLDVMNDAFDQLNKISYYEEYNNYVLNFLGEQQ